MTNVTEIVRRTVEQDAALRKDLARGLINIRALSRYIQETEKEEEPSVDALISAIRRYPIKESSDVQQRIGGLLRKLTMRNKIADISIWNDPQIPEALGKFASEVDYGRGGTFRFVAGVESIRVVLDEKKVDEIRRLIPAKSIRKVVSGLTEIIVSLAEEAEMTPGVVSVLTTELTMQGINMIEFMSCVPELVIVVDEKDGLKAYESIESLAKG
jgi:hypothetical protein